MRVGLYQWGVPLLLTLRGQRGKGGRSYRSSGSPRRRERRKARCGAGPIACRQSSGAASISLQKGARTRGIRAHPASFGYLRDPRSEARRIRSSSGKTETDRCEGPSYGTPFLADLHKVVRSKDMAISIILEPHGHRRTLRMGPGFSRVSTGDVTEFETVSPAPCPTHAPNVREWGQAPMRAAELYEPQTRMVA